jgi:hypothetical protein
MQSRISHHRPVDPVLGRSVADLMETVRVLIELGTGLVSWTTGPREHPIIHVDQVAWAPRP